MSAIMQQATATILDHMAEVIEGTNGNNGIPGVYSHDELLRGGAPSNLSITATGGTGDNTIQYTSGAYAADRWVKTNIPGFWLLCYSATNSGNVSAARKISAWTQSTTSFTTASFPANITTGDKFYVLEGFKRLPDGVDIESAFDVGFDRSFRLEALPGTSLGFYGSGLRTYDTTVILRLRLLKHHKDTTSRASVFENLRVLKDALALKTNWESSYTRFLDSESSDVDIQIDDAGKVVAAISFRLVYRVDITLK